MFKKTKQSSNSTKPVLAVVLSDKQKFVIDFLKDIYNTENQWASPTLVGRAYGIRFLNRQDCHSATGSPILKKLTELGFTERNEKGWYRFLKNYR